EAKEPERSIIICSELVPCVRRHVYKIEGSHFRDRGADKHPPSPALNHDRMHVLMPLERRIAAWCDLEIPQLAAKRGIIEQDLTRDFTVRNALVLFVGAYRDTFPVKVGFMPAEGRLAHARASSRASEASRTAVTKRAARSPTCAGSASNDPPTSSM